jgi:outer membrane protein OmpA-like peptidoglycan-associated protein
MTGAEDRVALAVSPSVARHGNASSARDPCQETLTSDIPVAVRVAPPSRVLPLLALACLVSVPAVADDVSIDVQLENQKVLVGKAKPTIVLGTLDNVSSLHMALTRSDGKKLDFRSGPLRTNATKRFPLDQPVGEFKYEGTLTAVLGKKKESIPVDFTATVATPPKLAVVSEKFDLANRTVFFNFDHPAAKAEIRVTNDMGGVISEEEVKLASDPPGKPVSVQWAEGPGTVMQVHLRVYDPDGFYDGIELFPWNVNIPHEEVNFATDSAKITPDQESKVDASYDQIAEVVTQHGRFAPLKLYVAGHTDTVGSDEHNQKLSEARARSIGEYFRRKGLRIPILYEGFGEKALMIATPDQTDEPRNRRAEYIVSIEDPPIRNTTVVPHWKPLR